MSTANACHGALGGPFFDHFFDHFFASILDGLRVRFGLVLGSSWPPFGSPNRVKLGQKLLLSRHFFENDDFHETLRFPMVLALFCP